MRVHMLAVALTLAVEIRTYRGDRPGMLHGWSLLVRPPDELGEAAQPPASPPEDADDSRGQPGEERRWERSENQDEERSFFRGRRGFRPGPEG
jgi:hypothetical protein